MHTARVPCGWEESHLLLADNSVLLWSNPPLVPAGGGRGVLQPPGSISTGELLGNAGTHLGTNTHQMFVIHLAARRVIV